MNAWTARFLVGRQLFEEGRRAQMEALQLRCGQVLDADRVLRCTADAEPAHECRYDRTELPGTSLADEERWGK